MTVQMEIGTHSNYISLLYGAQFVVLPFLHLQLHSGAFGLKLLLQLLSPHLRNIFSKHFEAYFSWLEVLTLFLFKVIQSTGYSIRSFLMYAVFHFEIFPLEKIYLPIMNQHQ
jgi:hypothetical protein